MSDWLNTLNATAERRMAASNIGPMQHGMQPTIRPKQNLSAEIAREVEAFLQRGGKIQRDELPVPSFPWPARKSTKLLISLAAFCRQYVFKEAELYAAARDGKLNLWEYQGTLHLIKKSAVEWSHTRKPGAK